MFLTEICHKEISKNILSDIRRIIHKLQNIFFEILASIRRFNND